MTRPQLTDGLAPLVRALAKRAGARPLVENAHSRPWSSITFNGARHRFTLLFEGRQGADQANALCDGLDYTEFDLGAYILVDIAILENRALPGHNKVVLEALTIEND